MSTVRLEFVYRDNNGRTAVSGLYYPDTLTPLELYARAQAIQPYFQAVSSATIVEARFSKFYDLGPPAPAELGSNSRSRLLLLCKDASVYGSFEIPSPATLAYLPTGPFRGFKVDKSSADSVSRLETVIAALSDSLLPYGDDFPSLEWEAAKMETQ